MCSTPDSYSLEGKLVLTKPSRLTSSCLVKVLKKDKSLKIYILDCVKTLSIHKKNLNRLWPERTSFFFQYSIKKPFKKFINV